MPDVILHIGTHKTATTTIQDMFAHNAALLARHGIIYPRLGKPAGHHGLVADWNPQLPDIYLLPGGSRAALRKLAKDHAGSEGTLFISTEEFSRATNGQRADLTEVRELLAPLGRVHVLCTLREQWQFIQSVFLEVSKSRSPMRPTQLANIAMLKDQVDGLWTDYNLLYDHLLKSFPAKDITFIDFDTARKSQGGIIGQVLRECGTDLQVDQMALVHNGQSNSSSPALPTCLSGMISAPQPASRALTAQLAKVIADRFDNARTTIFTRDDIERLTLHFGRRNNRLYDRLAAFQPDFRISTTSPGEKAVYFDMLDTGFWIEASKLFLRGD